MTATVPLTVALCLALLAVVALAATLKMSRRSAREIDDARGFLDSLINAIPTPILVKDAQHRYIGANPAFCRFFQRDLAAILGKTDYDFFPPEDAAFFQTTDKQALAGTPVEYERSYLLEGRTRGMSTRKTRLMRPDGSPVVLLLMIVIT